MLSAESSNQIEIKDEMELLMKDEFTKENRCECCIYRKGRHCVLEECFFDVEEREEKIRRLNNAREILRKRKKIRH